MGERKKIKSFEDLEVYQKILELHLEISKISLKFSPNMNCTNWVSKPSAGCLCYMDKDAYLFEISAKI